MKKLTTLLLVIVMVFSLAGVAFAAEFSDTADLDKTAKGSIAKLNALNIINGYPDGTFKPGNTITRAEFAKIACIISGMEKSAEVLKNTPSKFTDIASGQWYTGYINLAASQNFVKGFPDGTYRPNAQITYAEVITVLLRILGYNDNLPGPWPVDYVAKGASLDITDDISFDANGNATRADVAVMTDATLDCNVVEWDNDTEKFNEEDYTLLEDSFDNAIVKDVYFTAWEYDADKEQFTVEFNAVDIDNDGDNDTSAKFAQDGQLAGVALIKDVGSKYGDVIWNDDDDEIAFIDITSTSITAKGKDIEYTVKSGTVTRVEIDGKGKYDVLDDDNIPDAIDDDTYYYVYLNDDSEVYKIAAATFARDDDVHLEIVDEYDADDQILTTKTEISESEYDFDDKDVLIVKNNKWVDADELEENDIIYVYEDSKGVDYYIEVKGWSEGEFSRAYNPDGDGLYTSAKIGGTEYFVADDALISRNDGADFDYDFDADGIDDMNGETVKYFLDKAFKIAFVMSEVEGSGDNDQYGVITKIAGSHDRSGVWSNSKLTILLSDGKTVTYELSDDADSASEDFFETAVVDTFVVFEVDADGDIEFIEAAGTEDDIVDVDEDRDLVKIGTTWYDLTDASVVFNVSYDEDDDEAKVESLAVVDEDVIGETVIFKANSSKEIEYLVFDDATLSGADDDYCLVVEQYYIGSKAWVDVDVRGAMKSYEVKGAVPVADAVYQYSLSGSKIEFGDEISEVGLTLVSDVIKDYSVSGKWIELNSGARYWIDEDTYIYDFTADDTVYAGLNAINKRKDVGYLYIDTTDDEKLIKVLLIKE